MPSRVASSLSSSLNSRADSLVTYSVQEYEDLIVRLCKTATLRHSLKLSMASNLLLSSTFNKISMQRSLESAYQQAWEARNILKTRRKSFVDERDPYHVVLPHLIGGGRRGVGRAVGSSSRNRYENLDLFERGYELIQLLTCSGAAIDAPGVSPQDKIYYQRLLKDIIRDSDSLAVQDIQSSIRSIRHRLRLGGVEALISEGRIKKLHWQEVLFDPCVFTYSCSMCATVPVPFPLQTTQKQHPPQLPR
jgi:hypothetical protein